MCFEYIFFYLWDLKIDFWSSRRLHNCVFRCLIRAQLFLNLRSPGNHFANKKKVPFSSLYKNPRRRREIVIAKEQQHFKIIYLSSWYCPFAQESLNQQTNRGRKTFRANSDGQNDFKFETETRQEVKRAFQQTSSASERRTWKEEPRRA